MANVIWISIFLIWSTTDIIVVGEVIVEKANIKLWNALQCEWLMDCFDRNQSKSNLYPLCLLAKIDLFGNIFSEQYWFI